MPTFSLFAFVAAKRLARTTASCFSLATSFTPYPYPTLSLSTHPSLGKTFFCFRCVMNEEESLGVSTFNPEENEEN
jgi:hypothetical protein